MGVLYAKIAEDRGTEVEKLRQENQRLQKLLKTMVDGKVVHSVTRIETLIEAIKLCQAVAEKFEDMSAREALLTVARILDKRARNASAGLPR